MKRPDLVVLVAVWNFLSAFMALIGLVAVAFALAARVSNPLAWQRSLGPGETFLVLIIIVLVLLIYLGVAVAAGLGVLRGREWGRILALVQAALSLFSFPFGTTFGVLILVYLMRAEAKAFFEPVVAPVAAPAPPEDLDGTPPIT
jgi:hypothetical protein